MRKLALFAAILLIAAPCTAQLQADISGIWFGTRKQVADTAPAGGPPPAVWMHIERVGANGWKAVFVPDISKLQGIPLPTLTVNGATVSFIVEPQQQFRGAISLDGNTISGEWKSGGADWRRFDFRRVFVLRSATVGDLVHLLDEVKDEPDSEAADKIYGLRLTERLSSETLSKYSQNLPGSEAKAALEAVADASAFLNPPPEEVPNLPAPDLAEQRQMIARTANYLLETIHRLPNFFATRTTTTFQRRLLTKMHIALKSRQASQVLSGPGMLLHIVGKSNVIVRYQKGEEHDQAAGRHSGMMGLTTTGEFGPILETAMLDSAAGQLAWSHWEQGPSGLEAVFRYTVGALHSHYKVEDERMAYEGQFAVDPRTGTILRVLLRGNPMPSSLRLVADIDVEYGPVQLGGKTYICPVKSVALSQDFLPFWLNDVAFDNYHVFRSSSRILTEDEEIEQH